MEITINEKPLTLNFGVRFVRELDKINGLEANGVKFGMGLTKSLPALQGYDPAILSDVLYAALYGKVAQSSIDRYIENLDVDDLEKLFDGVVSEIEESNATKLAVKKMKP